MARAHIYAALALTVRLVVQVGFVEAILERPLLHDTQGPQMSAMPTSFAAGVMQLVDRCTGGVAVESCGGKLCRWAQAMGTWSEMPSGIENSSSLVARKALLASDFLFADALGSLQCGADAHRRQNSQRLLVQEMDHVAHLGWVAHDAVTGDRMVESGRADCPSSAAWMRANGQIPAPSAVGECPGGVRAINPAAACPELAEVSLRLLRLLPPFNMRPAVQRGSGRASDTGRLCPGEGAQHMEMGPCADPG